MATSIKQLNKWANAHTSYPIDMLRIALGVFLFLKGVSFVSDRHYLNEVLNTFNGFGGEMLLIHYVGFAHMIGGFLIVIGFFTRWSIYAQLPIILSAVLINFFGDFNLSNFLQASIAFMLCLFFSFYGSGKHSVDYNMKMEQ